MASGGARIPVTRVNSGELSHAKVAIIAALMLATQAPAQVPFNPSAGPGRAAGGRGGRGPAIPAKQAAPIDMTGYWVSVVTEDWKFRMVMPKKGNYAGVPLNAEGRKTADAWDAVKDESSGNQCRAYGAAGLMRVPGRFHITWDNDTTMKVESDAGLQTRLFHFAGKDAEAAPTEAASLQGYSLAEWEIAATGRGQAKAGNLKVVTTDLLPGYLRSNGVPYSSNTVLTEYYDRITAPNGDEWLVVSTEVKDPKYLTSAFITSTHFKKLPDAQGWMPQACPAK
jgi:hypothetical protein